MERGSVPQHCSATSGGYHLGSPECDIVYAASAGPENGLLVTIKENAILKGPIKWKSCSTEPAIWLGILW